MNNILKIENVSKRLANDGLESTILDSLSFEIQEGEFAAITGPSGSGKTTLLYLLGGLDLPTEGKVFLDGEEISAMGEDDLAVLRNKKLGFVYQFHFLLPEFSALENVMMPMIARGKYSNADADKRARQLLEEVDMSDKLKNKPAQLSGGQQQRVAIARALANEPRVLLADEPTGNLDSKNSALIYDLFGRLNEEHGQTIIIVTHDEHFAQRTRRRLHIIDGRIDADVSKY